jgi:ribosomal-protein-alanine N-acetyltransferase
MIPVLETTRLFLRPLGLADAVQVQELFPHWEIVRYLTHMVPWPYPPDGAYKFIRDVAMPGMERDEAWHWTLRLKVAPGQLIGVISLRKSDNKNRGFWLGLPWQRQGLMSEASTAATDYWFDVLKFPVLRAPKAVANTASRRISEKQGMRVVAHVEQDLVCGRLPAEVWEITAEEWRARRQS